MYHTSSIEEVTLRLIDGYRQFMDMAGRNLTTDNLYTSIPLAEKLLQRHITTIGTVRHNRRGFAKKMKSLVNRE